MESSRLWALPSMGTQCSQRVPSTTASALRLPPLGHCRSTRKLAGPPANRKPSPSGLAGDGCRSDEPLAAVHSRPCGLRCHRFVCEHVYKFKTHSCALSSLFRLHGS